MVWLPALSMVCLLRAWTETSPPGTATALAVRGGSLIVGSSRGLYRQGPEGWGLVLARGSVRDLAVDGATLLIATESGLYGWAAAAPTPVGLPLGAGARVRGVAVGADGTAWVASDAGLFFRASDADAFRRETALPPGPVYAVRTYGEEGDETVWVATPGALWMRSAQGGFRRRLAGLGEGWWELNGAVRHGAQRLLSVPRGLWQVDGPTPRSVTLGIGALHALVRHGPDLWLAAERGLYRLAARGATPVASRARLQVETLALRVVGGELVAVTRRGIHRIDAASDRERGLPTAQGAAGGAAGDDVRALQRAVLSYLHLFPSAVDRIEARARRVALLPEVSLQLSLERGSRRERDHDQSFSSGELHNLLDRGQRTDRELELGIELSWDLGRAAAPNDALAVSRERRQLIELRDQVLERTNRLHFERLRTLARRDALGSDRVRERAELELLARELAAQLDAWTGGRYSRPTPIPPN